jgi:dTMP kinase
MKGTFVTFEGVEGSGKSTQIGRVADRLRASGAEVVTTREPGGTLLGRRLRSLLLEEGSPVAPQAELLLYAADRAQHLSEVVLPALARGAVVLCDRYLDATLAYQGHGRRLGAEAVLALHRSPPLDLRPVRTVFLDLPPEEGLLRARRRNQELGISGSEGRFETETLEFHQRVRDGYLALVAAEPERIRMVEAGGPPVVVEHRILEALEDLFPALEGGG